MLRKVSRNIVACLAVIMTVLMMVGTNKVTAQAADSDQTSVTFSDVTYNVNTGTYKVTGPTVNIPDGKTVKYVTINVSNGSFNTSSVAGFGTHHYNYSGSSTSAYSDLIILNSTHNTKSEIIDLFTSIEFTYNSTSNPDATKNGIAIYATMSTNEISLPSTNFSFYQIPGTDHYYMYVPVDGGTSWHAAYNSAKQIIFGGLRGYLATISDAAENNLMREINGTQYAWVGGTSIYNVPSGDASSSFSTWKKIGDVTTIAEQPTDGSAYATPHGKGSPSALYQYYYWADGPESGKEIEHSVWSTYSGGEPNGSGSIWNSTLKRATGDYTSTEDCALTNWNGGLLNDYAETQQLDGYFVEFIADPTYANGYQYTAAAWAKGNANATFTATKELATLENTDNTITFKKFLVMNSDAYTPSATFSYSIIAGAASTDGKVYAGDAALKVIGSPVISKATFTTNQATYDGTSYLTEVTDQKISTVDLATVGLQTGEKFAVSNIVVDFGGVNYTEPGVYRYIVTETPSNLSYIQDDPTNSLILDAYVSSVDGTGNILRVTGYVLHKNTSDIVFQNGTDTASAGKVAGFVNKYLTENLTVKKTVSGNQSRTDEFFDFNLNISNAVAGSIYDVAITGADNKSAANDESGNVSTTKMTVATDGTTSGKIYLKAGESFTVKGLAKGTKYTVGENLQTLSDKGYVSTLDLTNSTGDKINGLTGTTAIAMDATTKIVTDGGISDNTLLVVNNDKTGIIPTGVIIAVAPYVTLALGGFFGLIVFARHKKSRDDEEEEQQ